jgi:hypothetical protein
MTFAQAIADQLAHDHDENIRRIRAQAEMRAKKLNLDKVMFADHAERARHWMDPEPSLQEAERLMRRKAA